MTDVLTHVTPATGRRSWEPAQETNRVAIEMCGKGGTSLGPFTRKKDAGTLYRPHPEDERWDVWSDGDPIGLVQPGSSGWAGYGLYEPSGEQWLVYSGPDFMRAVSAVFGHPPYGYSWYRVKRDR